MSKYDEHPAPPAWEWYSSSEGDLYEVGPCPTRQSAIDAAIEEELGFYRDEKNKPHCSFFLIETKSRCINACEFLENHDLRNILDENTGNDSGTYGEDYQGNEWSCLDEVSDSEWDDLTEQVRKVIFDWQRKHKLSLKCAAFDETRNEEKIDIPLPEDRP